jgi:hypothetical protein
LFGGLETELAGPLTAAPSGDREQSQGAWHRISFLGRTDGHDNAAGEFLFDLSGALA